MCVGYGVPVPSVKWYSRGNVLTNSSGVTVSDGYLRISNVTRSDTGSYSCVVKNNLKTERYSVYLTVQGGIRTTRAISISMRSHGLRQLVDDKSLLQVVNRLVAS